MNAADLLGWSDRVGTLEPRKFADPIAVDGGPIADVRILQSVRFVMKGGEVIKGQQQRKRNREQIAAIRVAPALTWHALRLRIRGQHNPRRLFVQRHHE